MFNLFLFGAEYQVHKYIWIFVMNLVISMEPLEIIFPI